MKKKWTGLMMVGVLALSSVLAYVATRFHRSAAFVLGGFMLGVAVLMLGLSAEVVSGAFAVALLTVGPIASVLGGLLHRRWSALAAVMALLVVTGSALAQEVTAYGEMSSRAPKQLSAFAFLIGKWEGTGRTRLPDGKVVEYPLTWIGRYILDGTAIEDEIHGPGPDGTRSVAVTFRQYDRERKTWVIEFLALGDSRFFRQVSRGAGSVAVSGRNVTVISGAPGGSTWREHYVVADNDSWVYRQDFSSDGGKSWNEGRTEYALRRSK